MEYIIKNHKTEYVIFIDKNASLVEHDASMLLKQYLDMAFDIDLKISSKMCDRCISVHSSNEEGVSFVNKQKRLYLSGEGKYGAFDAVIEFLNKIINLEIYAKDVIKYRKRASLKKLNDYHYVPSIKNRISSYGWIRIDDELKRLTRVISNDELFITGNKFHNAFEIINYHGKPKQEWFSHDKKQLCYSNIEMKKQFIKNLKLYLLDKEKCDLNKEYFVLGMEDNLSWCHCSNCNKHSPSELMINFVNDVEKEINKDRKNPITFLLFAYYNTLKAPLNVRCNENVGVIFAPIKMSFINGFNEEYLKELECWSETTNHLFAWTYNFYTRRNLFTYDTFGSMKKNYSNLINANIKFLYDQTESYSLTQTGFSYLKAYLQQKLMWDISLDTNKLINQFFKNYFLNYSDQMKDIFIKTRNEYKRLYRNNLLKSNVPDLENDENVYSEIGQTIDTFPSIDIQFRNFIDKTNSIFEYMLKDCKSNKDLYKKILIESIQYKYWKQLFNKNKNKNDFYQFLALMNEVGITHFQEGKKIGENMI